MLTGCLIRLRDARSRTRGRRAGRTDLFARGLKPGAAAAKLRLAESPRCGRRRAPIPPLPPPQRLHSLPTISAPAVQGRRPLVKLECLSAPARVRPVEQVTDYCGPGERRSAGRGWAQRRRAEGRRRAPPAGRPRRLGGPRGSSLGWPEQTLVNKPAWGLSLQLDACCDRACLFRRTYSQIGCILLMGEKGLGSLSAG